MISLHVERGLYKWIYFRYSCIVSVLLGTVCCFPFQIGILAFLFTLVRTLITPEPWRYGGLKPLTVDFSWHVFDIVWSCAFTWYQTYVGNFVFLAPRDQRCVLVVWTNCSLMHIVLQQVVPSGVRHCIVASNVELLPCCSRTRSRVLLMMFFKV